MLLSMTGFGRGRAAGQGNTVQCDLRSVNHRFLELNLRLPRTYGTLEPKIRERIGKQLKRGRVDCFITVDAPASQSMEIRADPLLAERYLKSLRGLQRKTGAVGEPSLEFLASQPGVITVVEKAGDVGTIEEVIVLAVDRAIKNILVMRKAEGRALKADVKDRCRTLRSLLKELKKAVPKIQSLLRGKIQERLKDLAGNIEFDSGRLEQELAVALMKTDVAEELTRLSTHLDQMVKIVEKGGTVGRKLDFLLQEANREITTCGNKIQGMEISSLVVEMKTELEKIREQVQNVE